MFFSQFREWNKMLFNTLIAGFLAVVMAGLHFLI